MLALAVVGLALQATRLEGQGPVRLGRVMITGNQRVDDESVRVRLGSEPGALLDEATIDSDIRALYRMGFFDEITASLEQIDGEWVLTYEVTERPFVRDVKVEGTNKIGEEEVEGMLRVRPNTIFNPRKARLGMEEVEKAYEKKGYLDAAISYDTTLVGENEVVVTFAIDEGSPVRIKEIALEGNREFSDRQLKGNMSTKESNLLSFLTGSGNLDREVLDTDAERLTAYYYEHGHIDVRVAAPLIEREEDGLKVTFKIDEGEVYQFGEVDIVGETLPEIVTAEVDLKAEPGETFRPSRLREDMNMITQLYGDQGYAFVNVTPETEIDAHGKTVDVHYRVVRGPEVFIDRIEISGNTKTRDNVIRRELELEEQRRFAGSKLRRSQERLRRLGFFEDVNMTTRKAERDDRLDVIVDVREGNTGSFSAGAGISSGNQFLFNVRLSEINLFGRGQRLILNADLGTIQRNISLRFTEPYFLATQLSLGVDVFNWELDFDDFTRGGTGGGVRLLYPLTALGLEELRLGRLRVPLVDTRLGFEYKIEEAVISDVSPSAATVIRAEEGSSLTSAVVPRLFRDTRNHPFDPTEGSIQDFSVEVTGLGGDTRFVKIDWRARWYLPVWHSESFGEFTLATGWNFGYGIGYAGERDLPLFERYFPGGINSVRGYEIRSLGPRVPVFQQRKGPNADCPLGENLCANLIRRDVVGGSTQLIFNNEIIFPLVRSLGLKGVLFFDAGNAFSAAQGIDFSEMRMSVGFGVRWLSPIGPLRIEVGFPLNEQPGDETEMIQFSFGGIP